MSEHKFKVGDEIIYVGPAQHGQWPRRRREAVPGKIVEVIQDPYETTSTGLPIEYRVDFREGPFATYCGVNGADIRAWFPVGTRVTGKTWAADLVTGVITGSCGGLTSDCRILTGGIHVQTRGMVRADELSLDRISDDVRVAHNTVRGNRRYLHRITRGQDLWALSYSATKIDDTPVRSEAFDEGKPWAQAITSWFRGFGSDGRPAASDWEIVSRYSTDPAPAEVDTKEEEIKVAQEFIGARPDNAGPKYQTPFQTQDGDGGVEVVDGLGHVVATVDLDHDYVGGEDDRMASAIAEALNKQYDPALSPERLRIAYSTKDNTSDGMVESLAFEVRPGYFLWGSNQAEIERAYNLETDGWRVAPYHNLFDLGTGEKITG